METGKSIAAMFIGLIIMGGSLAAWHYWQMDGVLAFIIATGGATMIEEGFRSKKPKS